jgi:hypothetical protein
MISTGSFISALVFWVVWTLTYEWYDDAHSDEYDFDF